MLLSDGGELYRFLGVDKLVGEAGNLLDLDTLLKAAAFAGDRNNQVFQAFEEKLEELREREKAKPKPPGDSPDSE